MFHYRASHLRLKPSNQSLCGQFHTCQAATMTMNMVAFVLAARARRRCVSAAGRLTSTLSPPPLGTAGRVKSVGSSKSSGAPASCLRQYARCASSSPPSRRARCHALKSGYWMGSGSRSGPAWPDCSASYAAASSEPKIASLRPSLQACEDVQHHATLFVHQQTCASESTTPHLRIWCLPMKSTWSSSPMVISTMRRGTPRADQLVRLFSQVFQHCH